MKEFYRIRTISQDLVGQKRVFWSTFKRDRLVKMRQIGEMRRFKQKLRQYVWEKRVLEDGVKVGWARSSGTGMKMEGIRK